MPRAILAATVVAPAWLVSAKPPPDADMIAIHCIKVAKENDAENSKLGISEGWVYANCVKAILDARKAGDH